MTEEKEGISRRKIRHFDYFSRERATVGVTTLLEEVQLVPAPLSGVDHRAISTECSFLGHDFQLPLLVSSITGGAPQTEAFNMALGSLCEKYQIPMALGSIRPMLEDEALKPSFGVKKASGAPFVGANIGAVQACQYGSDTLNRALDDLAADALFIHLNIIQELAQPGGDRDFTPLSRELFALIPRISRPVVMKETGCGISGQLATRFAEAGAAAVEVAGAGGSSFLAVEMERMEPSLRAAWEPFLSFGIPTAASISQCAGCGVPVIGSGGLRSGLDLARALVLGAGLGGIAAPLVVAWHRGGYDAMGQLIELFSTGLRTAMTLTGSRDLPALAAVPRILGPGISAWLEK
ncbi:type 2 isopentenyl-diphosphate Delta-isomerase [Myxococcota bacterium]|nr:type 2 isopentenyl-diphosphate Delta-isomerase [Myxococcota bacterium]MBU1537595.1 type 2 isopentenyl-diphosphate Delta-isomerase [Myxococcota bacterium]